jgi:hypothetical protein
MFLLMQRGCLAGRLSPGGPIRSVRGADAARFGSGRLLPWWQPGQ